MNATIGLTRNLPAGRRLTPQIAWELTLPQRGSIQWNGETVRSLSVLVNELSNRTNLLSGASFELRAKTRPILEAVEADLCRGSIVPEAVIGRLREVATELGGTIDAYFITAQTL